mmetsp:Transcript_29453/g.63142  ORF Transcript_29453/g.63142 Transcript_29453/m.63142 type:complete len:206 (+) Transcript_29453:1329-1946(+)
MHTLRRSKDFGTTCHQRINGMFPPTTIGKRPSRATTRSKPAWKHGTRITTAPAESSKSQSPIRTTWIFFCFYHQHDDDTDDHATPEDLSDDEAKEFSWHDHSSHSCLRPCSLLERDTGSDEIGGEPIYTVHLYREDNGRVVSECGISMDYVYSDVPHSSVRLLDLPFTTDVLRPNAFRHEIGVPEGFYPTKWLRKKSPRRMRGRT